MCTHEQWTNVYPNGFRERMGRWVYCDQSRYGQPCNNRRIRELEEVVVVPGRPRSAEMIRPLQPIIQEGMPRREKELRRKQKKKDLEAFFEVHIPFTKKTTVKRRPEKPPRREPERRGPPAEDLHLDYPHQRPEAPAFQGPEFRPAPPMQGPFFEEPFMPEPFIPPPPPSPPRVLPHRTRAHRPQRDSSPPIVEVVEPRRRRPSPIEVHHYHDSPPPTPLREHHRPRDHRHRDLTPPPLSRCDSTRIVNRERDRRRQAEAEARHADREADRSARARETERERRRRLEAEAAEIARIAERERVRRALAEEAARRAQLNAAAERDQRRHAEEQAVRALEELERERIRKELEREYEERLRHDEMLARLEAEIIDRRRQEEAAAAHRRRMEVPRILQDDGSRGMSDRGAQVIAEAQAAARRRREAVLDEILLPRRHRDRDGLGRRASIAGGERHIFDDDYRRRGRRWP